MFRLLLLFAILPLVELTLLLVLADYTSWWVTIGLVLTTGLVGASLARWQGFRTIRRIQDELRRGEIPADALLDGLLILIAGALLITPGILTDLTGFALLAPPVRAIVKRRLRSRMVLRTRFRAGGRTWSGEHIWSGTGQAFEHDEIIDVQVRGPEPDAAGDHASPSDDAPPGDGRP